MIHESNNFQFINQSIHDHKNPFTQNFQNEFYFNYPSYAEQYNDNKVNHLLEMLVDSLSVYTEEDINLDWIEENINSLVYKSEEYNIKDVRIKCVDNISCDVLINYDYLEKINEDRDDVTYTTGTIYLNYIDNPKVLKKS